MATFLSTAACSLATIPKSNLGPKAFISRQSNSYLITRSPKIYLSTPVNGRSKRSGYSSSVISCSLAKPETLQTVKSIIAKQLSIDDSSVSPDTKFADLGADSLDTVEIMMALEEQFGVSIGEGGAENIATVQDAADLIEKVKAAAA